MKTEQKRLKIFEHGTNYICAYSKYDALRVLADREGYPSYQEYCLDYGYECEDAVEMDPTEALYVEFEGWYDVPEWLKTWAIENEEYRSRSFNMRAHQWAGIHPRGLVASEEQ